MDLLCPRWVDPIRQFPRAKRTGISLKELIHLSTLTRCLPLSSQPPSSVAFPDPFGRRSPGHAAFAALKVSGRRWRIRFPRCWPPSAAQTVHAVFPHTAFTKTHASGMQSKVSTEQGLPAHTHRRAWSPAVVSNRHYAIACIGVTGCDARSSRGVG